MSRPNSSNAPNISVVATGTLVAGTLALANIPIREPGPDVLQFAITTNQAGAPGVLTVSGITGETAPGAADGSATVDSSSATDTSDFALIQITGLG